MGSNANESIDTSVNAPSENSSQPMDTRVIQFNRVPVNQTSVRPQNQRLSNILQGWLALQLAANETDNSLQDGTTMSSGENKRKRAAIKKEDESESPPAKRTRSSTPSSSTEDPSKIDAHADQAAKPIPFGAGREYQAGWRQDRYIFEDRIIDFLYDVPGWGPNRAVSPIDEDDRAVTGGDQVYDEDEELMFTMDDLFDFDRYYTS